MNTLLSFPRKRESFKLFVTILLAFNFTQLSFAQIGHPHSVQRGNLIIKITGFESNVGECWFGLDNSEEIFESEDTVFIGKILPIVNREVNITIDSLPYGNYAIRVFHDENSNGELDTDILGIPSEDYGYSNDASGWFGPPSWENAEFLFNLSEMEVEIIVD